MLTGGHIAASYLIAESAVSIGIPVHPAFVAGAIICGNLPDIDFLTGLLNGKTGELHHRNITHTPVGAVIFWIGILILFRPSPAESIVFLASLLTHLTLDDLGYWLFKLRLSAIPAKSQINWFFPITPFTSHPVQTGNTEVLCSYLRDSRHIVLLEIVLISVAVIVFLSRL